MLSVEVLEELRYWRVNLRRLNWIRKKAGVQVVWFKRLYSDAGGCMRVDKKVCEDTVGLQDCRVGQHEGGLPQGGQDDQ